MKKNWKLFLLIFLYFIYSIWYIFSNRTKFNQPESVELSVLFGIVLAWIAIIVRYFFTNNESE